MDAADSCIFCRNNISARLRPTEFGPPKLVLLRTPKARNKLVVDAQFRVTWEEMAGSGTRWFSAAVCEGGLALHGNTLFTANTETGTVQDLQAVRTHPPKLQHDHLI